MSETINMCPFRTYVETRPAILKGQSDITVTGFMGCLKEKCPAWYLEVRINQATGEKKNIEHCLRLDKWR